MILPVLEALITNFCFIFLQLLEPTEHYNEVALLEPNHFPEIPRAF